MEESLRECYGRDRIWDKLENKNAGMCCLSKKVDCLYTPQLQLPLAVLGWCPLLRGRYVFVPMKVWALSCFRGFLVYICGWSFPAKVREFAFYVD
jgi:hypothetical protein